MRVAVFSARQFEHGPLGRANAGAGHELVFLEPALDRATAALAGGFGAVSMFVTDTADAATIEKLAGGGVRLLALRSAGFNNVDLEAADRHGLTVARVPAYSPYSVAEHAVGLILMLNRKFHRAHARVREQNFALGGLLGFDLHRKTVGVIGTGRIGEAFCRIMGPGFGCALLAHDPYENGAVVAMGGRYVGLEELYRESDIVSIHCPLTPQTHHLIGDAAVGAMKDGVMLINTSRGAVIDTRAVIRGLKSGKVGTLGLDVYEEEGDLFFRDLSDKVIQDDVFARLTTFPNVVITAHQAFFTREALDGIAQTTIGNISAFESGAVDPENLVTVRKHVAG